MVQAITNMVIEEKIQVQVETSITHFDATKASISSGSFFEANSHSKTALRLAERSFLDPNMVAMLYFPDDHKYAIYIPLFLPVSLPLFLAVVAELKQLWKGPKQQPAAH